MLRVTLFGKTKEECEKAIADYFERYAPGGYDTEILSGPVYDISKYMWVAKIQRSTHCE